MFQIVEAVVDTLTRFADRHGPRVALAVIVVVGCGVALRVLYRLLAGGESKGT